jgi:hypothetical protein
MHKQLIGLAALATAAALQVAVGAEPEHNPVAHEPSAARADTELAQTVPPHWRNVPVCASVTNGTFPSS